MLNNKSNPLRYMINGRKNVKKVWPCCYSLGHHTGANDMPVWQTFLTNLCLFDSIFSGIFWNIKLHYFDDECIVMEIFSYRSNDCHDRKKLHYKIESYKFKLELTGTSKMYIFRRRAWNLENFPQFALRIETGWTKKVFKSILEIKNATHKCSNLIKHFS